MFNRILSIGDSIDWNRVYSIDTLIIFLCLGSLFACVGFFLAWPSESIGWLVIGGLLGFFWPITLVLLFAICMLAVGTSPIWLSIAYYLQWKDDREERKKVEEKAARRLEELKKENNND